MKETRRQIIENARNEVAKGFNAQIKRLKEENERIKNDYWEEHKKYVQAATERDMLKDKIAKLEDWNVRLQEYMDMPEDERKEYLAQQKEKAKLDRNLNAVMGMYASLFSF